MRIVQPLPADYQITNVNIPRKNWSFLYNVLYVRMLDTGSKAHRTSKSQPGHKLVVNPVLSTSALGDGLLNKECHIMWCRIMNHLTHVHPSPANCSQKHLWDLDVSLRTASQSIYWFGAHRISCVAVSNLSLFSTLPISVLSLCLEAAEAENTSSDEEGVILNMLFEVYSTIHCSVYVWVRLGVLLSL